MGRFTELTDAQVSELARAFGAGEVTRWKALDAGTINSNFEVVTDVDRFFLRINEGKTEDDVRYEAELVRELAERGVHTPLPWNDREERPYTPFNDTFASWFQWVAGEHLAPEDTGGLEVEKVGGELARMHNAGLGLGDRYGRPGIYTFDRIVERYMGVRDTSDPELREACATIGREVAFLEERTAQREAAPRSVIHADLFRDNVLFHDQGVTLLDFEQACWGSMVYDLAVCINAWCYGKKDFHKGFVKDLCAGYGKVRPLIPAEAELLYVECRAAAMRFAVTRITDVYLAQSGVPGKDFRRYVARLERLRALSPDEFAGWTGAM